MEDTSNNVSAVFLLLEAKIGGKNFLSVAERCYWWGKHRWLFFYFSRSLTRTSFYPVLHMEINCHSKDTLVTYSNSCSLKKNESSDVLPSRFLAVVIH